MLTATWLTHSKQQYKIKQREHMQFFLSEIINPQEQICSYPTKIQFLSEYLVKSSCNWEDNELISFFLSPYKKDFT